MNVVDTLKDAGRGWSMILSGKGDWRSQFDFTARGLNQGFVLYFLGVLFSVVGLTVRFGAPVPMVMVVMMAGYSLPVLALILSASGARRLTGFDAPVIGLYVPGLLMLAFMAFVGGLTLLIGIQLWGAIVTLTAFMVHRLARVAAGLDFAPALGFALVNFLAGLPLALYMMGGSFAVFV